MQERNAWRPAKGEGRRWGKETDAEEGWGIGRKVAWAFRCFRWLPFRPGFRSRLAALAGWLLARLGFEWCAGRNLVRRADAGEGRRAEEE
jgi:hypothetical protein